MTKIKLTAEEMASLRSELAELEGPRRAEMVEAIAIARAHGDLSENFEYHDAKNAQGLLERQITILRAKLEDAEVVAQDDAPAGRVGIGSRVQIEDEAGDRMEVTISNAGGAGTVSPESPMGKALSGAGEGDRVTVAAPGASWKARVLKIR
jgi:transcription elongation factor GreA